LACYLNKSIPGPISKAYGAPIFYWPFITNSIAHFRSPKKINTGSKMSELAAASSSTTSKQTKSNDQLIFTTTPMTGTTGTDAFTPGDNNDNLGEDSGDDDDDVVKDQDRLMPIANVARIMKQAVPQSAKISKDAKECVQECVSEFISFVSSEYFQMN
jgi:hypothetical protein